MASHTSLMACTMMHVKVKSTLSVETETRPNGDPPIDRSPLKGTAAYYAQEKDVQHTHVCYYTTGRNSMQPIVETLPLPKIQPKCPPGWSAEAWDLRFIYGTDKYHFYYSARMKNDMLVLKVSDRREDGTWVYESIDPRLLASEKNEVTDALDKMLDLQDREKCPESELAEET